MTRDELQANCEIAYAPTEAAFIADLPVREVQKAIDEDWFDFASRPARSGARRALGIPEVLHLRLIKDTGRDTVFRAEAKKTIHRQLRERLPKLCFVWITHADADHRVLRFSKYRSPAADNWLVNSPQCQFREFENSSPALIFFSYSLAKPAWTCPSCDHTRVSKGPTGKVYTCNWDSHLHDCFNSISDLLIEPVRISEIAIDATSAWKEIVDRLSDATAAKLAVVSDPEIRGGEPVVRGTRIPAHLLLSLADQGATTDELLADYPALDEKRLKLALLYARNHPRVGRPKKRPWQIAGRDE